MSLFNIKGGIRLVPSEAPSAPLKGAIYFDSVSDKLFVYDGVGWEELPQIADVASSLAGNGLVESSGTLAVNVDDSTIEIVTNTVRLKDGGIADAKINASADIALSKLASVADINRALVSDASGKVASSTVTATELGYLSGVTSAIQDQLNAKADATALSDYALLSNLASTANGDGASLIGLEDAGLLFTATNVEAALAEVKALADAAIPDSEKGAVNGVASLDVNGKVPLAQLPNSIMEYKGTYDADTNTPTLANGVGNADTAIGDVYRVTVAGTVDFGAGNISFDIGDYVILNDSKIWEKAKTSEIVGGVSSVNSEVGDVVLDSSDLMHTQATPANWTVADASSIAGHLDELASRTKAQEDAGYISDIVEDTTPQLGGDLDLNGNAVLGVLKRGSSDSTLVEEEYFDAISLDASQTNTVIAALNFAHASFEGCELTYKLKGNSQVRIGTLRVVTDGTAVAVNDVYTETGETNISFDAVVNGANINIRYSSTQSAAMKADVKRIKA